MASLSFVRVDIMSRRMAILLGMLGASCTGNIFAQAAEPRAAAGGSELGTIEGVVIYESDRTRPWRYRRYYVADRKKGQLAEAVVCLAEEPLSVRSDKETPRSWVVDQKDYRFIPETLAVRSGDQINFTNSDPLLHDVSTRQRKAIAGDVDRQGSFSLRQKQNVTQVYRDAGGTERPVTLSCRFHSAMRGWIYVFDHPFFQVTDKEGAFRLTSVPAGSHRIVMVHPAGNLRWDQTIKVNAGQTHRIEIRVSPDNLLASEE